MQFYIIIPARFASSRFPGKVLADIDGSSMLARVYARCCHSNACEVIVATDDAQVQQAAEALGARVCMTAQEHTSGSARVAEAARQLNLPADALIVNVQCDQPLIDPNLINKLADTLAVQPAATAMATAACPLQDPAALHDPDVVKVVCNQQQQALYFSRAVIPYAADEKVARQQAAAHYRHIGIYAYRMEFLQQFVAWQPSPLEHIERLEQLRVLWYGRTIQVAQVAQDSSVSVDKPEDLRKVQALLSSQVQV